ncbi:hypothetical protein P7K49_037728 [Saguinus oedipus]|uniref:Uncharacterized protein n=1 Tax=Saguinus oedipus TaxID=9490 RepID=A0ABQ9TIV2_SAGOE|nr:hypothetical protein P7K49_037728 [Saguinus oedipus]
MSELATKNSKWLEVGNEMGKSSEGVDRDCEGANTPPEKLEANNCDNQQNWPMLERPEQKRKWTEQRQDSS